MKKKIIALGSCISVLCGGMNVSARFTPKVSSDGCFIIGRYL